jgi:hypothetical protein
VLAELEAELASLSTCTEGTQTKRVCQLRTSGRYGKYLKLTRGGRLSIDQAKVHAQERLDGKFVVHSNDDTVSAEDMALATNSSSVLKRPGARSKAASACARSSIGPRTASTLTSR